MVARLTGALTNNQIPRKAAAGLVASALTDDGTTVASSRRLTLPAGTADAPGLRVGAEEHGIWRRGSTTMSLSIAGVEAVRVAPGGIGLAQDAGVSLINSLAATGATILTGSTSSILGGQVRAYGHSHATKPSWLEIVTDNTVRGTVNNAGALIWAGTDPAVTPEAGTITAGGGVLRAAGGVTAGAGVRSTGGNVFGVGASQSVMAQAGASLTVINSWGADTSTTGEISFQLVSSNAAVSLFPLRLQRTTPSASTAAEVHIGNGILDYGTSVRYRGTVRLDATSTHNTSAGWTYYGDSATDGTWRIGRDGDNLVHQRRESGTYVTKATVTP